MGKRAEQAQRAAERHERAEKLESALRHMMEALHWAASQKCFKNNCGTVCLCGPCHARKSLETLDPEWVP